MKNKIEKGNFLIVNNYITPLHGLIFSTSLKESAISKGLQIFKFKDGDYYRLAKNKRWVKVRKI